MTTYVLCKSSVVQSAPTAGTLPAGSQSVNPSAGQGAVNPQTQTFHVVVTGSGSCSATVQPVVSNDGVNWTNYGSAIVVSAGAAPVQAAANGAQPWQFFSAYVTAISGTSAQATCTMGV
jgi:hypothetical protein